MSYQEKYEGYKWIKVDRYKRKEENDWESNYLRLERHHVEETTFLIEEIKKLAAELDARDERALEKDTS